MLQLNEMIFAGNSNWSYVANNRIHSFIYSIDFYVQKT